MGKRSMFFWILLFVFGPVWSRNELWQDSVKLAYDKGDFKIVEHLLLTQAQKEQSAALYFNLGNTAMKQGKIGEAVWNFEQAALMNPTDDDIQHNLAIAKNQVRDEFEEIPKFSLFPLMTRVNQFVDVAWLGLLAYLLLVSVLALAILHKIFGFKNPISKYWKGVLLTSMILLTWAKLQASVLEAHVEAVVMKSRVTVVSEPNEQGKVLFQLFEGVKVEVEEDQGEYMEIVAPNGAKGWVKMKEVRKLGAINVNVAHRDF